MEIIITFTLLALFIFALFVLDQGAIHTLYVDGIKKETTDDFEAAQIIKKIHLRYGAKKVKIKSKIVFFN